MSKSVKIYIALLIVLLAAIIYFDATKAKPIDWTPTNSDYLYEIKNPAQKHEFEYLSYLYNYIWYGEFELDDETFYKAKTAFENAIKSLRNV